MTRAALFDVDGTLVDTNYLHVTAWWEAFRQTGHTVAMPAIHRAIGLGSEDLVAHLLGPGRDRGQDADISARHSTLYATRFEQLAPVEGAADLLRALAGQGWTIVLATSASGTELAALRRALDADDVISGTASSDDVDTGKPAPDPIRHALEIAGATSEEAVYIGDSVWDMKAASTASVPAVGLLSGGIPATDLEAAGAVEIHDSPAALLGRLDTSVLTRMRS
ncbi:HAD family hydrolase [Streptomyces sp. OfavH-34-F]|uniref:HAD family hydrolase n=1 Tax=Streptomyces sp. OfavH-34-F TaxID=2917760 RepID=UPI001EF183F5|nr:HAD family hydrolase [Streptomyces sp. OfavH-34-F]MCG7525324.1 HAD family hydrolase [Streptomyces sp. OfavH-34-F]